MKKLLTFLMPSPLKILASLYLAFLYYLFILFGPQEISLGGPLVLNETPSFWDTISPFLQTCGFILFFIYIPACFMALLWELSKNRVRIFKKEKVLFLFEILYVGIFITICAFINPLYINNIESETTYIDCHIKAPNGRVWDCTFGGTSLAPYKNQPETGLPEQKAMDGTCNVNDIKPNECVYYKSIFNDATKSFIRTFVYPILPISFAFIPRLILYIPLFILFPVRRAPSSKFRKSKR